jgi:hypothetical protein
MFLNGLQNFSRFNLDLIFFHPAKFFLAFHGKKNKLQEKNKVWNVVPSRAKIIHSGTGPSIKFAFGKSLGNRRCRAPMFLSFRFVIPIKPGIIGGSILEKLPN